MFGKIKLILSTIFLSCAAFVFVSAGQNSATSAVNLGNVTYNNSAVTGNEDEAAVIAQDPEEYYVKEDQNKLSLMQQQARLYREEGIKAQGLGNLDAALAFYQKAIEADPGYAIAYNDLGVIYEAAGDIERAEANYLKAAQIEPDYLSPYTNLAYIYENKRDLNKAAFYWSRRAELGLPDEAWTQKARARYDDLVQLLPELRKEIVDKETISLIKEAEEKEKLKKQARAQASLQHLEAGRKLYSAQDYSKAIDEFSQALSLDPENQDAFAMLDSAKRRIQDSEKKQALEKMQDHFQQGIKFYQQDDLQAARQEFKRLDELSSSPQRK